MRCSSETGAAAVKLEGGEAMAPTVRVPVRARHSGDGACRPDAAGGEHARRLWRARPHRGRSARRSSPMRRRSPRPAPSRSSSKAWSSRSRSRSPAASAVRRSASARRPQCDGQVLVTEDMLGMFERTPRFVKRFDDLAGRISAAVETYAADVRSRAFPGPEQTYAPEGLTASVCLRPPLRSAPFHLA